MGSGFAAAVGGPLALYLPGGVELWLDATKLQCFDLETGTNLAATVVTA